MFVFDVSDTEAEKDAPPLPKAVTDPFKVSGGQVSKQLPLTMENAERDGVRIAKQEAGSQSAGVIRCAKPGGAFKFCVKRRPQQEFRQVPIKYEILFNADHSSEVRYAIDRRVREDLRKTGDFSRVHPLPQSGQDVADDMDARLVVLSPETPYSKDAGNKAEVAAKGIWESRGNTPRLYRNALVFLAVDQTRLQDLDEAVRRYLAWDSVLAEKEQLNLDPHQVKQAETQKASADTTVTSRLPEAYQWLIVPTQAKPDAAIEWLAIRLSGGDALAVRASKRLVKEELLVTRLAGTRLRMELDRTPLWRGDGVAIRQLAEDFARYIYLPRLADTAVLREAVTDGVGLLTWRQEGFAYADGFDEAAGRYRGLKTGQRVIVGDDDPGLLVKPEVAEKQQAAEVPPPVTGKGTGTEPKPPGKGTTPLPPPEKKARRFHGTVELDPTRVGRDAGKIADEVIVHLAGIVGAEVKVTLEIEADIPSGVPDNVVRTVTENGRTLKFTQQGFEAE